MTQTTKNQMFWMLQDVITHFGENPRKNRCMGSLNICNYNPRKNSESIGCAIGMYLDTKTANYFDHLENPSIINIYFEPKLKAKLPKWMQKMPSDFLHDLQKFHDVDPNFTDNNISDQGKIKIKEICKTYDLPFEFLQFPN